MQESGGALDRVGDKGKAIGLMQVQLPTGKAVLCSPGQCTAADIINMVREGVLGHSGQGAPVAPGIAYALKTESNNVGAALRVYNTGHLPDASNFASASTCSTSSYVSDIANRLIGLWSQGMLSPQALNDKCGFAPATIC